jgi:hypothetical protein
MTPVLAETAPAPAAHPFDESDFGHTEMTPTYRIDLRPSNTPDVFFDAEPVSNWSALSWAKLGRPYRVERWSKEKRAWEREHGEEMPVKECWMHFNRSFQKYFDADPIAARRESIGKLGRAAARFDARAVLEAVEETVQWSAWQHIHKAEDAIWDPRGKRALFEGLDVKRPNILFLGAADGYEAMQIMAMYPGGHAVLVDYDEYCRDHRFGAFPADYPFIGLNPATGGPKVWYRDEMNIDFEVCDIRDLKHGADFDVVVSIGLVEHFPDQYKPLAFEMHRKFLKPGGRVIMTTPRLQLKSKIFYTVFADAMNFAYRELMDITHLGLYAWENGFEILRHGRIKAHNGLICRTR